MAPTSLPTLFAILITLQAALIVFHDLVDLPGWHRGRQVRAAAGSKRFWIATLLNAVFPSLAVFYALRFWLGAVLGYSTGYWATSRATAVCFAIAMWWLPEFFGAGEETKRPHAARYARARQVLPARGDNPRPNPLHPGLHALFMLNPALRLRIG